jgi:hypothetical protein
MPRTQRASSLGARLPPRLSDAGFRHRDSKAVYPNHRHSAFQQKTPPRGHSSCLLDGRHDSSQHPSHRRVTAAVAVFAAWGCVNGDAHTFAHPACNLSSMRFDAGDRTARATRLAYHSADRGVIRKRRAILASRPAFATRRPIRRERAMSRSESPWRSRGRTYRYRNISKLLRLTGSSSQAKMPAG